MWRAAQLAANKRGPQRGVSNGGTDEIELSAGQADEWVWCWWRTRLLGDQGGFVTEKTGFAHSTSIGGDVSAVTPRAVSRSGALAQGPPSLPL